MPDSVASQVMNEIVQEVGKSASASVRPFLAFWKHFSYIACIVTTAWTLSIVFVGAIGFEMENVWQALKWMCSFFAAFGVLSGLHALTSAESAPAPRRRRRYG